ncbi:Hsp70 family protein [Oceanobacter mangrovi]|uniref:Hsp70 family protein n=1 Tax=Oceanobacter mangrovi TaxID=2862510 RepID=UPI001C8EAB65|nr:molecular chaperone HscC [Oceanobacter mangrovi]
MAIIGIDLGTTNSACAVWQQGQAVMVPNRLGKFLTPSVVGIDEGGNILVGETARERLISHPAMTVAVFKRAMGSQQTFRLGKKSISPIELSSLVLQSLKEDAEAFLNEPVQQAVISVPAYFNDLQRKATRQAAQLAGLEVERLINEPTAAAMVYGLHEADDSTSFLILDLGGGTFDVTLVEYFAGVLEVHASSGDNFLGGEDFTKALVEHYLRDNGLTLFDLDSRQQQHLYSILNDAKHALASNQTVAVKPCLPQQQQDWLLSRDRFEELIAPLLQRIRYPVEKTLRDSEMKPNDIDEVVLVGGSTRMLPIRSLVSRMFGRLPAANVDPDLVVAMGTAIQAGLKEKNSDLDDVVLTDVCPYSLGTDVINEHDHDGKQGQLFMPIIERNSTVPTSIEKMVWTAADNQTRILIGVYQGESRLVKNNVYLGELEAPVPRGPRGKESATIRFSYDMNGLLEVDVTITSTGQKVSKAIVNAPGQLSEEEIARARARLSELKFHPRDSEENRLLIARAERLYESLLDDEREYISRMISQFEAVLERQQLNDIRKLREQLSERLDMYESGRYF